VPAMGDSITEGSVSEVLKQVGALYRLLKKDVKPFGSSGIGGPVHQVEQSPVTS
jgi:hypothetical protein